jgi:peptidyl-prolyl cis-trans isomerase D
VAQKAGIEATDLGMKTRAEILDPKVAEAGFAAKQNEPVAAIEGALEPSILRVTEIEPGGVTSLEEASPKLRQDLALRAAREAVRDTYDKIEDERAGGATLEEIAKSMSLPYRLVENVARDATTPDGKTLTDLPAPQQLLEEAFESDVGVENNAIRTGDDVYVFYEVLGIEPERDRTLEEAKAAVTTAWRSDETEKRISEKAEGLLARLEKGEPLANLAAEIGKPVETAEHVKRNEPQGLSANAAAQAFAGPQGHVANAEGDTPPDRVLLKVDKVTAPAFFAEAADSKAIEEQLAQAVRNDILSSYNRELLQSRETRLNNAAYAQITGNAQAQ